MYATPQSDNVTKMSLRVSWW